MKYSLFEIEKELKRKNKSYTEMLESVLQEEAKLKKQLDRKTTLLNFATDRSRPTIEYDIKEIKFDLSKIEPYKKELKKLIEYQNNKQAIAQEKKYTLENKQNQDLIIDNVKEILDDTIKKYEKLYTYEVIFTSLKKHDSIMQIVEQLDKLELSCDNLENVILKTICSVEQTYKSDIQLEKYNRSVKNKKSKQKAINSLFFTTSLHAILSWASKPKGQRGW